MKVYIPNFSEQTIGGGWTFLRNFTKATAGHLEFVNNPETCDLMFVVSVSMVDEADIETAVNLHKRIVFRVDNVPKKSRNKRGKIYRKMKRLGEVADIVVYQSEWAKEYAGRLAGTEYCTVIYNGVDTSIFNTQGRSDSPHMRYLFVQYNRDENKRYPEAAYHFHMRHRQQPDSRLTLVGQFSPELMDADFDFFDNEQVEYIPPVDNPQTMAAIYKRHDFLLFPAFADAAPNTVLEARACGLTVELVNPIGGTEEMLNPDLDISLERMAREYLALFDLVCDNKYND